VANVIAKRAIQLDCMLSETREMKQMLPGGLKQSRVNPWFGSSDWQKRTELQPDPAANKLDVLLHYKDQAKSAVPTLLDLLRSIPDSGSLTNQAMRQDLLNAIRQLDPAATPSPQ
jgi:hypothetical protein